MIDLRDSGDRGDAWVATQLEHIERRLASEFADEVPPAAITEAVRSAYSRLEGAPVREYVPVLVARAARERLRHRTVEGLLR